LTQNGAQVLRHQSGCGINAAACGVRHHNANRFSGPILRQAQKREHAQNQKTGELTKKVRLHGFAIPTKNVSPHAITPPSLRK
jgi:hypothetical protein